MSVSTCVNCHQPVAPTDDICETCGAVLLPLSAATLTGTAPIAASYASPSVSGTSVTFCPNCKQPVSPGDEICETCGVVLVSFMMPTAAGTNSTPSQETCPQCQAPRVPG